MLFIKDWFIKSYLQDYTVYVQSNICVGYQIVELVSINNLRLILVQLTSLTRKTEYFWFDFVPIMAEEDVAILNVSGTADTKSENN